MKGYSGRSRQQWSGYRGLRPRWYSHPDAAAKDVHVRKGHTYNVPSGWELRQIWVYGGPKLVRACNAGTGASYLCRYGNKYGEWRWTPMAVVDYPAKRQYQPRVEATYHDVWVVIKSWGPLY